MPTLSPRPNPRKPPAPPASRQKVLIVRQPMKSVRHGDHPSPLPLRLAIAVLGTLGVVALIWLMGEVGYRLGFAPLIHLPELVGPPGGGLITGLLMLMAVPSVILRAGLAQPALFILGFLLIALPAGALGGARPLTPGGPRQATTIRALAYAGVVGCMFVAIMITFWTISAMRTSLVQPMPFDPMNAGEWLSRLKVAAGLDVLAFIASAVWVVLIFRLPVATWARSVAGAMIIFSLLASTIAMAITSATSAQLSIDRSLCVVPGIRPVEEQLMLGDTRGHVAMLGLDNNLVQINLLAEGLDAKVIGRLSIEDLLSGANEQP